MPKLNLEKLEQNYKFTAGDDQGIDVFDVYRAKIPGGWLVLMCQNNTKEHEATYGAYAWGWGYGGATFVPDPEHKWDGSSID